MKKFVSLLLMLVLVLSINITSFAEDHIYVMLDGKKIEFDVEPQIINGRTMVPIRAIFEKMGASVVWDGNTSSAICTKGDKVVKMAIFSKDMQINDQIVKMDVSPVIVGGRTLAPARYVAEAFEADVQWNNETKTVVICSKDVYAYTDYPDVPDLGRCYNVSAKSVTEEDGFKAITYVYSDMSNASYYNYLYDNSIAALGDYVAEDVATKGGKTLRSYTKKGETIPRYFLGTSSNKGGSMTLVVMIPKEKTQMQQRVKLYYMP